jgi:hypothetical protein
MILMTWAAEVTNDPTRNYELYLELLEDGESRCRVFYDHGKTLKLRFYGGDEVVVPAAWLVSVIQSFTTDTSEKPTS